MHPELIELPEVLAGERVMLRPYRPGDGEAFFAAVDSSRAKLSLWLAWIGQHRTREDSEAYVRRMRARWLERTALIFGIWSLEGGEFLGGTGFHGIDWSVPSFELGYFLCADAQGKGYASEAVRLVTDFGFRSLSARRIWASCDAQNARSIRLLGRCGYAREAMLRNERRNPLGALRDTLIFSTTDPT